MKGIRTKSGCFSCRARRKKCDERKPTCLGCERNALACDWPMYEKQSLHDFRKHTLKKIPRPQSRQQQSKLLHLEQLNITWQEKSCLEFILGPFVNLMCPTPAADMLRGHIRDQIFRDEVFRKVSICLGNLYNPYLGAGGHHALLKDALESFRSHLFLCESEPITVDTLHCVTFLNLLEILDTKRSLTKVILHMQTLFKIMCTIISDGTYQDTPIFRICADSFFYHYGLTLICSSNGESECLPSVWSLIAIWNSLSLNGVHDFDLNPMLGDKFVAISYVNRACFIFRSSLTERKTLAFAFIVEIENIMRLENPSRHQKILLETAMVLLLEIAHPNNEQILCQYHDYTKRCIVYLLTLVLDEGDFTFFWVFLICGLCIDSEIERQKFRSICGSSLMKKSPQNFGFPLLGLIEKAWEAKEGFGILNSSEFTAELHELLGAPRGRIEA